MIRPYAPSDKPALLELLRLNTPTYFAPEEEEDFIRYLDQHLDRYYVISADGEIAGCGGYNHAPDGRTVHISWDIFHPQRQGQGLGSQFTRFRINEIRQNPAITLISVRTSQLVYPFYEKFGFTRTQYEKDFWAPGFDLYKLELPLT